MTLNLTYAIGSGHNRTHVRQDFDDITTWANNLDESDLTSSSGLFASYRTIMQARGVSAGSGTAATYWFSSDSNLVKSGASAGLFAPASIYFDDADYTMSGRTQKLRLRAQLFVNTIAPTITYTVGLYPVTAGSGIGSSATLIGLSVGTVVAGSTVAFATPAASSTTNQANSGDFAIPADGTYVPGVVLSGTQAANSCVGIAVQLQTRYT